MKRILSLLLSFMLLLSCFSGCSSEKKPYVPTGDGLTWDENYTGPMATRPHEENTQALTLAYYPDRSMNPILCTDYTNRALFTLLYQSLFTVDWDYNVEPVLCKQFSVNAELTRYTFYIEPNVTFSNGHVLTPADVEATLEAARQSQYYRGRFLHVLDISLEPDGGITVQLETPCENLPLLLDIPIIPSTQLNDPMPTGTGPYYFERNAMGASLRRRTDWWCKADMIVTSPTIALLEAESITQLRDEFQFSDLSVVCADPGSDRYADYRCDYELWDCENGIFLYLAVCEDSTVFSDPEVRKALTYAIDRDMLVEKFYRGFARSATLPASPLSPYYNQALAARYAYDGETFQKVIAEKNLQGKPVTMLVNKDDSLRLRVAREIASVLKDAGLDVKMSELSTAAYEEALMYWRFDIYLGQTRLSANMDLSAFFHPTGALSWGDVNDVAAYTLSLQAIENHGNYYTLHQTVMENGLLCPVLFRSYAIYATRGAVTGLTPSRDNVFYYSLGKNMEHALIRD